MATKKQRRKEYMTIFVNGKQKQVKRLSTIEGMDPDEYIRRNADPIWLLLIGTLSKHVNFRVDVKHQRPVLKIDPPVYLDRVIVATRPGVVVDGKRGG